MIGCGAVPCLKFFHYLAEGDARAFLDPAQDPAPGEIVQDVLAFQSGVQGLEGREQGKSTDISSYKDRKGYQNSNETKS